MNVSIRTTAREDLLRQYGWYLAEAGETVSQKFLDAVEAAVEQLRRTPDIGSPRELNNPLLSGLRSWPVHGFPASRIYYIHSCDEVHIIRVLHGKRDIHSILEGETDGG